MDKKRIILFACFALCSLGMTMMQTSCLLDPLFWDHDDHGDFEMDRARECYVIGNYSNEAVLCYMSIGKTRYAPTTYPDTLLPEHITDINSWSLPAPLFNYSRNYISYVPRLIICHPDEKIISDIIEYGDGIDTVSVFFLSRDTVFKYGYYEVQKRYQILARYDICKREFKERKEPLLVRYPPMENMRDIKMTPSFEELMGREGINQLTNNHRQ